MLVYITDSGSEIQELNPDCFPSRELSPCFTGFLAPPICISLSSTSSFSQALSVKCCNNPAPKASPSTLMTVQVRSTSQSTARTREMSLVGSPTASRMMASVSTPPAGIPAAPTLDAVAVTSMTITWTKLSGMLFNWAIKTVATHWKAAAPSMLTVAPIEYPRKTILARLCMVLLWFPVMLEFQQLGEAVTQSDSPSYDQQNSDLGLQILLQMTQEKPHENLVVSPYGVASILGMLLPGAHGNTKQQLLSGLRLNRKGPYKMLRKLHKILTSKTNSNFITIANALFPQEGFNIHTNFLDTNRENFLCDSHHLNYNNPQKSADFINTWIQNRTNGHIHSLVTADIFDPSLTRLVVVNSIYFKGKWKSRFLVQNTKMRSFTGGDGKSYKVPMMSQLAVFNVGWANTPDGVKYRVIELPYQGNHTSMFIAFPLERVTPMSTILPHLTTKTVNDWAKLMRRGKIRLLLPKFTTHTEMDLKKPLSALGITEMFIKGKADFQHLSSEPVYLSTALQTSKIEVNEDGTKAAAATSAVLMAKSSPSVVIVDRPFLYFIRHISTGTVLFAGLINKP